MTNFDKSIVGSCSKCGAPQGIIGWLCGCWYEGGNYVPQWMKDDYKKSLI